MNKLYILEARHKDGSLNAKFNMVDFPDSFISGISENDLFDYYFQNVDREYSASWEDMRKYFEELGLNTIRVKTW